MKEILAVGGAKIMCAKCQRKMWECLREIDRLREIPDSKQEMDDRSLNISDWINLKAIKPAYSHGSAS
jgi:hypothetical protein